MYRSSFVSLLAICVLFNSAPVMAKHTERPRDSRDRTQDYLEPADGPSLRADADGYGWNTGDESLFSAPDQPDRRDDYNYYHGWQRGYSSAAFAPIVTIISMVPVTTTTTTITEEVYYETVRRPVRKKIVRKWKAKPRCGCR